MKKTGQILYLWRKYKHIIMGTSDNGQEVLRQNLEEKGTFQALYQMHLLFREKGKRPEGKKILGRLQKEFGQVDLVADVDHSLATLPSLIFR